MSAFIFLLRYRDWLNVPLDENQTFRTGIHLYVNPVSDAIVEEGHALIGQVNRRLKARYREATGRPVPSGSEPLDVPPDKQSAWYPALRNRPIRLEGNSAAFRGKGSPEEIELALAAAAAVERIDTLHGMTAEQKITHLVNKYVGLDCIGFASNYYNSCGYSWGDGPSPSTPPNVYAYHGREIGLEETVPDGAALLFPREVVPPPPLLPHPRPSEHIAVSASLGLPRGLIHVAQSCSSQGGLVAGHYIRTGMGGLAKTTWSKTEAPPSGNDGEGSQKPKPLSVAGRTDEHIVHELLDPDGSPVYVVIRSLMG